MRSEFCRQGGSIRVFERNDGSRQDFPGRVCGQIPEPGRFDD